MAVGNTAEETAREVEQTRKSMEEKVAKLTERAPREARNLGKKIAFGVVSAVAVVITRKLVDRLWEKTTGELPPTKKMKVDDDD
jgi:ribosomal protein L31E